MNTPERPTRRKFIKIASAGSFAGATGGISALLVPSLAVAQDVLGADTVTTLIRMARDIYPHDRFEDALYAKAVAGYGDQARADAALRQLLVEGVAAANDAAKKQFDKEYAQVADEKSRLAVLKSIEKMPFFAKLRGDLVVSLYNQPAVWAKLGYQGPSAESGGYINRGFNDQNWMEM